MAALRICQDSLTSRDSAAGVSASNRPQPPRPAMIDATPLLRIHARRRLRTLAGENPAASQHAQLLSLIHRAAQTKFGRHHRFEAIRDVADLQSAVPLRRYEQMWREYWQPEFPVLKDCTWPGT